jgi:hypothetical protein
VDEDLNHPNRVFLADVILKAMRQQRLLHSIFAIDEPMHRQPPKPLKLQDSKADLSGVESTAASIACSFHTA